MDKSNKNLVVFILSKTVFALKPLSFVCTHNYFSAYHTNIFGTESICWQIEPICWQIFLLHEKLFEMFRKNLYLRISRGWLDAIFLIIISNSWVRFGASLICELVVKEVSIECDITSRALLSRSITVNDKNHCQNYNNQFIKINRTLEQTSLDTFIQIDWNL